MVNGQGHEMVNFGGQEVKGQGHMTPKLDGGGIILDDLRSSRFFSLFFSFFILQQIKPASASEWTLSVSHRIVT